MRIFLSGAAPRRSRRHAWRRPGRSRDRRRSRRGPCAGLGLAGPSAGRRPGLARRRRSCARGRRPACRSSPRRPPRTRPTWSWRLAHALADGASEIVICAALGGRTDHMLANVLLLAGPSSPIGRNSRRRRETLRLLRSGGPQPAHLELLGAPGDLLSLLPLGGDADGVTPRGCSIRCTTRPCSWARPGGSATYSQAATQASACAAACCW